MQNKLKFNGRNDQYPVFEAVRNAPEKPLRYKAVYWNKRRTLAARRDVESEPLPTLDAARAWILANAPKGAGASILKEHDRGVNDGKFFLHLIVR